MKRLIPLFIVLACVLSLFAPAVNAEEAAIYASCTQPSDRGSLFYLDIMSGVGVSGVRLTVTTGDAPVEYRSVSAEKTTSAVKAVETDGGLRLVLCDKGAVSGRLCRLTFKALSDFEGEIIVSADEVLDAELRLIANVPDSVVALSVSGSKISSKTSSKAGSQSSRTSSSKSEKNAASENTEATGARIFKELSQPDPTDSISIPQAVAAATLLIAAGIVIGRVASKRQKAPKNAPSAEADASPPEAEDTFAAEAGAEDTPAEEAGAIDEEADKEIDEESDLT